jgi:hypothetical protein
LLRRNRLDIFLLRRNRLDIFLLRRNRLDSCCCVGIASIPSCCGGIALIPSCCVGITSIPSCIYIWWCVFRFIIWRNLLQADVQRWIDTCGEGGPAHLVHAKGSHPETFGIPRCNGSTSTCMTPTVLLGIGRGLLKSATPLDWTMRAAPSDYAARRRRSRERRGPDPSWNR